MKNTTEENIKIKNSYFEMQIMGNVRPDGVQMLSGNFQSLMDKKIFPNEYKPNYWIGKVFDKIIQEMKSYVKARQDLVRQYAKKYGEDGKEVDENGKVTKEWKKGDLMSLANNNNILIWEDYNAFLKDIEELQEIEIDLGISKVEFDLEKGPDTTPGEMLILIPLLKEPE